jgi:hypothetical protein
VILNKYDFEYLGQVTLMFKRLRNGSALFSCAAVIVFSLASFVASAQTTNGSITIETMDATKALLQGTHLVLIDNETGVTREGTTLSSGTFTFTALPPSSYHLSVERVGFTSVNYDNIVVQAGVATPVDITLKVGSTTQKIEVSALSVPVIEVSSNTISTSINLEEVNNLPVAGRSLLGLQALSPGYASTTGNGTGTFNGTPQAAYQASVDGINSTSERGKTGGGSNGAVTLRVENIQEFTVQSGELPPSQGGGQSAVQTLFVTNRGTNRFHGRVFENHQDETLNAFPWSFGFQSPRLPKPHLVINDFGGAIGGPILKNRLFFFANFSGRISPNASTVATVVPTAAALAGNYSYFNASGGVSTINVLRGAGAAGFDPNVNAAISFQEKLNEASYQYGTFTQTSTQLNTKTLNFTVPSQLTVYYPSLRVDYTLTKKLQTSLSLNMTRSTNKNLYPAFLPGSFFQTKTTGNYSKNYVAALGIDYTITPNLLNQVKFGYLYVTNTFSPEAAGFDVGSQGNLIYGFQNITSGNFTIVPQGSFYPYLQANDDLSWQKGSHTIKAGGNIWHQQDHFYNPPLGYININLGVNNQDPASNPIRALVPTAKGDPNLPGNLSGAQGDVAAMYGWLNGRVTSASGALPVNRQTGGYGPPGTYNLDEVGFGGGFYVQDSWRVRPDLTFNYGLRWDMIGDQHDVKNGYTGPSVTDLFGSSGYLNIFQPGANSGNPNPLYTTEGHKYHANLVLPQPQIGFAWNPNQSDTWLGRLFGDGKTVIRGSYTLKNYTEGGQNFWQAASNSGYNFFNSESTTASNTIGPQFFTPGTVHLAAPASCSNPVPNCVNVATEAGLPPLFQTPSVYQATIPQSSLFFKGSGGPSAIDPYIKQPYVESWTLGIQRQIGSSSAFEIRYVGNRSIHDWISYDYNEVNSLNNGFLQDFLAAQKNLAINAAAGFPNDFSNHGGGPAMPILSAAFAGASASGFKNGSYVTFLNNGSLGGLAGAVANNETFFCNVVSQSFAPCAAVPTAPLSSSFPSNLFQVNPYLEGSVARLLSSKGSSNYNALQMEFRQKVAHGLDLNVNYTYAKALGNSSNQASGAIGSTANIITLHNLHYNYIPITYDIRNALKLSGTYALPFGKNRAFLSQSKLLNYLVGGWTAGIITLYQSGAPILLSGGLSSTINPATDGGVTFVGGTTARDIQKTVHVTHAAPHNSYVNLIGAKFQGTSTANPAYVVPNTTPSVEGNLPYIYGPKWNNFDLAATKDLPIFEAVHINFQAIFLNAFNHPEWIFPTNNSTISTQSPTFGTTSTTAQAARRIELRANVTF